MPKLCFGLVGIWSGQKITRRLIDVHFHLQSEELPLFPATRKAEPQALCKWGRIVDALGSREAYEQQYGAYNEQDVMHYITLDRDNANSLVT